MKNLMISVIVLSGLSIFADNLSIKENYIADKLYISQNLSGMDFSNKVLSNVNFSGSDLSNSNFSGATLIDVIFSGAQLKNAEFDNVHFKNVNFSQADLTGAKNLQTSTGFASFDSAQGLQAGDVSHIRKASSDVPISIGQEQEQNIDRVVRPMHNVSKNKYGKNLCGHNFSGKSINHANFEDAILDDARFDGAILRNVNFEGASLKNADFTNARIIQSNFSYADLTGVKGLKTADISQTNFDGAMGISGFKNFFSSWVSGSRKNHRDAKGSAVSGGMFVNKDLRGHDFSNQNLVSPNFSGAMLDGAKFDGATIRHGNFSHASLKNVDFTGATITQSNFSYADLTGVQGLKKARISQSNFDHARGLGWFGWW